MPNRILFIAVLYCMVYSACSYSSGVSKDLATGLTYSYKNCQVRDVKMVDEKGIPFTSNIVPINATFFIKASGVQNFQLMNGKVFPGCEITVKDKLKDTVGHLPDAFVVSAKDGIATPGPLDLSASIVLSSPLVTGETYAVEARFFDKQQANRELTVSVDVLLR
ncbi:MAG: hypothetical protein QM802_18485 [Agriterribacter sp.]